MSKAIWFAIFGTLVVCGCTPFDPYAYDVEEQTGVIDGCDKTVWVSFLDAKYSGDEYLPGLVQDTLQDAGWAVITAADSREGWSDGYDSGARYLVLPRTLRKGEGVAYIHIRLREGRSDIDILWITATTYPHAIAESFVHALEEITVYPNDKQTCD